MFRGSDSEHVYCESFTDVLFLNDVTSIKRDQWHKIDAINRWNEWIDDVFVVFRR